MRCILSALLVGTLVACESPDAPDDTGSGATSATGNGSGGSRPSATETTATGPTDSPTASGSTASGATCDPPNRVDAEGRCVASCGAAGGNQCVDGDSTLCEGLPLLESHDCAVCCHRPDFPAPSPSSFHFVYASSPAHWDAILALSATQPNVVFVGAQKPDAVPSSQWAAYLSYRSDPQPTAHDINALLVDPVNGPRVVMIEELHDSVSEQYFVDLASEMRTHYPQWSGRWGVFVSFANYPLLGDGIDALLQANATLSLELYPSQSEYCAAGTTGGARDAWLAEQLVGNASLGRVRWLMERRAMFGSTSQVTPLFGVGDVLLDGQEPYKFLDRLFYVWVTRTGYAELIAPANGGPGAYKWQRAEDAPLGYGVGSTTRDTRFVEAFDHYVVGGQTSSLAGPVPCD